MSKKAVGIVKKLLLKSTENFEYDLLEYRKIPLKGMKNSAIQLTMSPISPITPNQFTYHVRKPTAQIAS